MFKPSEPFKGDNTVQTFEFVDKIQVQQLK